MPNGVDFVTVVEAMSAMTFRKRLPQQIDGAEVLGARSW